MLFDTGQSNQLFEKNHNNEPSVYKSWDELFQLDPFLERVESNWLLHYLISSNHKKNDYGSTCLMCLTNQSS